MNNIGKSSFFLYSLIAVPLAFGALPLYMHLPKVYAQISGMSLAYIGFILWLVRFFDAITDPYFGRVAANGQHKNIFVISLAVFVCSFALLCQPNFVYSNLGINDIYAQYLYFFAVILITSIAYSAANIAYLTWGVALGSDSHTRTKLVTFREALTLLGVVLASVLPTLFADTLEQGVQHMSYVLAVFGLLILIFARFMPVTYAGVFISHENTFEKKDIKTEQNHNPTNIFVTIFQQFQTLYNNKQTKYLLLLFLLTGTASAIPGALFLFYVEDVIQTPKLSGAFLGVYFLAGIVALPLWLQACKRYKRTNLWLMAMLISVIGFIYALFLGKNDITAFMLVCVISGISLGAELCIPASIAADCGEKNDNSSVLFGWWNLITKLNLALATGIALPFLAVMGYQENNQVHMFNGSIHVISFAYVVIPVAIKILACLVLLQKQPIIDNQ